MSELDQTNSFQQMPRNVPANDLDMQMQVTDPAWQNLSPELQAKLMKYVGEKTVRKLINNKEQEVKEQVFQKLSGILAVYTRDARLGNLSQMNGEYEYVSYYFELAVDLLENEMPNACVVALNKALSKLEVSSSKAGFLRKMLNTFRHESLNNSLEAEKKSPLGGKTGRR